MYCMNAPSSEDQRKRLTPDIRNEIVRDVVTQMFAFKAKPDKSFCTHVAKFLVKVYEFMKDEGKNVSGYVSKKCI